MKAATRATLRGRMKVVLLSGVMAALTAMPAPAASQGPTEVDLKLVIATDVSRSINDGEADIQRQGISEAFANPEVVKAIQSGALGRIAVAMVDWSSPRLARVVLDWTVISDEASATALSETIRELPRTPGQRTSISSALDMGTLLLESSDDTIVSNRKVIDVSGDGPNNDGFPLGPVRDKTVAADIIVNGLPIMDENANGYFPGLDRYYAGCVAGGRGAFVVVVRSFSDFGAAMRHKLVLEISQNETQIRQTLNSLNANPLVQKAAVGGDPGRVQVLRPTKDYPYCNTGGFGFGGF